jgi:hypothetical protein
MVVTEPARQQRSFAIIRQMAEAERFACDQDTSSDLVAAKVKTEQLVSNLRQPSPHC